MGTKFVESTDPMANSEKELNAALLSKLDPFTVPPIFVHASALFVLFNHLREEELPTPDKKDKGTIIFPFVNVVPELVTPQK